MRSSTGDVRLVADASILDGQSDASADVVGNTITLAATGGDVGEVGVGVDDDLEIDTAFSAPGLLHATANGGLFLTEVSGALRVDGADATTGNIRLTVPDTAAAGQDLEVLAGRSILAGGSVTLRVGDNVVMSDTSTVSAGRNIDVFGDYLNADPGVGTTMDLRGSFTPGSDPGERAAFFGQTDDDLISFLQTRLGGRTFAYGSQNATAALANDGQDRFVVDRLASMNTARGDVLTLDGQADTDTYTVNTTGSVTGSSDYVVRALDTGSRNDGIDTLTVNGTADNDVFLLRQTPSTDRAFVALLHGSVGSVLTPVERVEYTDHVNARLIVNGFGGADYFAADDNLAITTLDGGSGSDTFQIGQVYGTERSAPAVRPADDFAALTTETTRGFLSRGISQPMTVYGGTGDDRFSVYSNQATLRLEGNDGNDEFVVRAFALAGSPQGTTEVDGGAGDDLVQYNVNAPAKIDGGAGFDKVVALGTEAADSFVVSEQGVFGAGLNVTIANQEALDVDGLEGDDHFFIRGTARGVVTTLIGGKGSDTFDTAGDVTDVITAADVEGRSGVINHRVTSAADAAYDGVLAEGIAPTIADPITGAVVIAESGGSTRVLEFGASVDTYSVKLASAPTAPVYVNVSAARSSSEESVLGGRTLLVSLDGVNYAEAVVLTFDATNWTASRTVFVKAVDDPLREGRRLVAVSHSVASVDPAYDRKRVRDVEAEVFDDDAPGLIIGESNGSTLVLEGNATAGVTDSYAVALTRAPAPGTTVIVALNHDGQVQTTDAAGNLITSLSFTPANWNLPQTVFVRAVNDAVRENRAISDIVHTIASGSDSTFVLDGPVTVGVTVVDDDSAGLLVTESDGRTAVVVGDALGDSYDIRLTRAPVGSVTVSLVGDGQTLVASADPRFDAATKAITFGVGDWLTPVTIRVAANPDYIPTAQDRLTKAFPLQPHTVNRLRGPLVIEGGSGAGADRSIARAVLLPGETDPGPISVSGPVVDESLRVDRLNVFNDASVSDDAGTLTADRISGLGMSTDLTLNTGTAGSPVLVTYPGGITYRDLEIVEVLLGTGNDQFAIQSTLTTTAVHGGITAVHGGGGDDAIAVTGGGGPSSPLVVYGDSSEDMSRYASPGGTAFLVRRPLRPAGERHDRCLRLAERPDPLRRGRGRQHPR